MRIAVIGAGNWGTGLAIMAARAGHEVVVWSRNSKVVDSINGDHTNLVYLTGAQIPETVRATGDFAVALVEAELIILAAPSHATRQILEDMISVLRPGSIIVSATKGIEIETGKRISQVVTDVVNKSFAMRFVCLSGPSFASEVVEKHPTAIVAASEDLEAARAVQAALSFENLRIYTNDDLVGTELGGSVKNVMAIAAGMVAGLGFGSNSVAALITRGLAEMTRLALREGAKLETMMGLAGLGDLVLTCTGNLSRNRFVGEELGKGRSLEDIAVGMNEVAEGINTTRAVKKLADRLGVEMPIANEVHAVLYERKPARDAATELMRRPLRVEANW
ncbi:MAG TPA: NAD(P)H-dependent glycerol-3-phosphate dehydrogenase [Pyrinomonadaceae bacterium]|nr:NAD(P)H-dependent glycerol-3-phosphate dehydrogenase [Pyrinomonadaceae bacterium]